LEEVVFVSWTLSEATASPNQVLELWSKVHAPLMAADIHNTNQFDYLVAAMLWEGLPLPQDWRRAMQEYMRGLTQQDYHGNGNGTCNFEYVENTIAMNSIANKVMITKSGWFGLAPAMAQEGDFIVRLFGSKSLPENCVFLPRVTKKPLHYSLIVPAWLSRYDDNRSYDEQGYADAQDIYLY